MIGKIILDRDTASSMTSFSLIQSSLLLLGAQPQQKAMKNHVVEPLDFHCVRTEICITAKPQKSSSERSVVWAPIVLFNLYRGGTLTNFYFLSFFKVDSENLIDSSSRC